MARLNAYGTVLVHLLALFFGGMSLLALKDINFSDLAVRPDISLIQGRLMLIFGILGLFTLVIGCFSALVSKNKKLKFLTSLSLVVIYTSVLAMILSMLYLRYFDETGEQFNYVMFFLAFLSVIIVFFSYIFFMFNFTDDRERRWFIRAVRQEIKHPSKMICPECQAVISSRAKRCNKCKSTI